MSYQICESHPLQFQGFFALFQMFAYWIGSVRSDQDRDRSVNAFIHINLFMIVSAWEFAATVRLNFIANIVGFVFRQDSGFFLFFPVLSKIGYRING